MLTVPRWKSILIVLVSLLSFYISIPTLFPSVLQSRYSWMMPSYRVNPGLDLKGGVSLLLEVDTDGYRKQQLRNIVEQLKTHLTNTKTSFQTVISSDNRIIVESIQDSQIHKVKEAVFEVCGHSAIIQPQGNSIEIVLDDSTFNEMRKNLMAQTFEIVHRRIDQMSTKEVDIQFQGTNRILLQVPGLYDPHEVKRILGTTAKLSLHLVDETLQHNNLGKSIPFGVQILPVDSQHDDGHTRVLAIKSHPVITGDMLLEARSTINEYHAPVVQFRLNNVGTKLFAEATSNNRGKLLAIVLDARIISAPVINEPITAGSGVISGNFSIQSANELALLLRAGALPAPINIVEERTVGPSLGSDSIAAGKKAVIAGVAMVVALMFICYGFFGVIANIALAVNLFMLIAILAILEATLTLPGIAGIVLTLAMAVDANVLIFERVKEEQKKGRTPLAALEAGYDIAFTTILDSNLTTIIAAIVLYIFGVGPVKGIAVTLIIGIICSMFTAVSLTKLIIAKWYRIRKPQRLPL
ncbi:protein translocase subunit SecD [Rickettsiales endosymbiont of Peranema trichophorum]|uniref:protein translocase subunit SecD n=1 Tax=Rickettsiales endosymbiont of Peranema trichophorum TaxID=2486577 RepID=UPI00102319D9|nr:protein translocase subunit SecD [Rickettsiales endosymbiont of Peranema trichophorum]RZI47413.1 protein translocase subunit SecD [Rickettsiales endosymbiont of Peranema trichophorum]